MLDILETESKLRRSARPRIRFGAGTRGGEGSLARIFNETLSPSIYKNCYTIYLNITINMRTINAMDIQTCGNTYF